MIGPVEQVEQVVLAHYAAGLRDLTAVELADAAAEVACLPGALADRMRALVDAERAARTEQPTPQPQPSPSKPGRAEPDRQYPGPTAPWHPLRGPRYLGQDDPMGVLHTRDDDEPVTPIDLPADAGWRFGAGPGRTATRLDGTPLFSSDVIHVPTCPTCEALAGEECECGSWAAELSAAPVILPEAPFDLSWLLANHVTAVDLDRQGRAA